MADSAGPRLVRLPLGQEADFVARAGAGNARLLFVLSPAAPWRRPRRVAAFRGAINRVTAGSGIDPSLVEGLVFLRAPGARR